MSNRNRNNSFFKRIIDSVTKPIKKWFTPKVKTPETPKKDNFVKRLVSRITSSFGSQKGTTRRVPTAKFTDYQKGWKGGKKPTGAIKDFVKKTPVNHIDLYGKKISVEKAVKLEDFVDKYNKAISETRKELIENIEKYLDPLVAENIILNIQRATDRPEMSFTNAAFDDLRDLDFEQFTERVLRENDFDVALADMLDKSYYNIQKRYEQYRENYIKAMYNEMGENTETVELAERLRSMSLDKFMVSYYDVHSGIQIDYWYPDKYGENPRVQKVHDYFDRLDKIDKNN